MNKVYEEFGEFFLNISVAIVVFVFIQPLVAKKFDFTAGLIAHFIKKSRCKRWRIIFCIT